MRIAFLADRRIIHTVRFTDYFTEHGHDVHLVTFEDGFDVKATVHRLKPGPGPMIASYLWNRGKVARLLQQIDADVIDAQQISSYGNLMAAINRRPWVASALGSDVLILPERGWFSRNRIVWALQKADLITSMSPYMTERMVALGIEREKVVESCFGIRPEIFNPGSRSAHRNNQLWQLISTRHLEKVYGYEAILQACFILKKEKFPFHLTIVGKGSMEDWIRKTIHDLDLKDYITMKGQQSQDSVARHLQDSDIFISASHSDGANISLLEAMACGCFPVVSDIPACRQWGKDRQAFLLFPVDNAPRLAECIIQVSNSPDLIRSAQDMNYNTVKERGTYELNMGRLEAAFCSLVSKQ